MNIEIDGGPSALTNHRGGKPVDSGPVQVRAIAGVQRFGTRAAEPDATAPRVPATAPRRLSAVAM
jgi:hypothetical protein